MDTTLNENMNPPPGMLPVDLARQEDVAAFFGVTLRTLVGWVRQGRLEGFRLGRRYWFRRALISTVSLKPAGPVRRISPGGDVIPYLVFDIETVPQDEARLLALAPEFTAAANLKDPDKIAASIAKKKSDYLADAALNWKSAEVVLIGTDRSGAFHSYTADSERELLEGFLELLDSVLTEGVVVGGHNVKGFDLPMVVNRARVHGLEIPRSVLSFWRGRLHWNENFFDSLEILSFGKSFEGNGVDDVARVFGLPPKLGRGGDFPLLWRADPAGAIAYNKRDVEIEIEIARRCGCF